jgi:hypothetical protein
MQTGLLIAPFDRWSRQCEKLLAAAAANQQLIDRSRRCLARSLDLLERTKPRGETGGAGDDAHRFSTPIVLDAASGATALITIADLITYVRNSGRTWAPLRSETFIAAALPSATRTRALRALAVATFRGAGIPVA